MHRLTSKRKSTGDGAVACNKAQSAVDETFAHKKRRRALKQMQEMTVDKEKGMTSEQQQDSTNSNSGAGTQKTMVLPKKRPLASQPTSGGTTTGGQQQLQSVMGSAKKQAKVNIGGPGGGDEAVDDETLIRETEAALKSLSGGWPGPRHSFYRSGHHDDDRYESPAFVNLFDEKKNGSSSGHQPLPPPPAIAIKVDENKNTCDVKPVQHQQQHRRDMDNMINCKIDHKPDTAEHNKKPDKYTPSKYEPDFNELVDDSSDELEIDMSAGGGGSSGSGDKDDEDDRLRRKLDVDRRNNNSHMRVDEMTSLKSEAESPSSYDAYLMDKTAFSAFRPVSGGEPKDPTRLDLPTAVGAAMSPLGPYPPAGATFVVGYTGPGMAATTGGHGSPSKLSPGGSNVSGSGNVVSGGVPIIAVKPECVKLEDDSGSVADKPENAVKMDSPSPLSKQYTILQPAGADSRAATALQDVAREGVLGASVVSTAGNSSPRTGAGTPKLGADGLIPPGCMNNKGEFTRRFMQSVRVVSNGDVVLSSQFHPSFTPHDESARNLALINIQGG